MSINLDTGVEDSLEAKLIEKESSNNKSSLLGNKIDSNNITKEKHAEASTLEESKETIAEDEMEMNQDEDNILGKGKNSAEDKTKM